MNTHIGMKNGTEKDMMETFQVIREDLMRNSSDLMNRYEYYTKKYRGNRLEDVNVGLFVEANNQFTAQIFVRNRHQQYIKEQIRFDYKGRELSSEIKYQLND